MGSENNSDAPSLRKSDGPQLSDLLARVEAATGPDRALDAEIICTLNGWKLLGWSNDRVPGGYIFERAGKRLYSTAEDQSPITHSLDAALALVERVLPGWTRRADLYPDKAVFSVEPPIKPDVWACEPSYQGEHPNPALALLAALLKALIADHPYPFLGEDRR